MQSARDWYREVTMPENGGPGMHVDLVFHWIRMSALLSQPFIPHFSEFLWMDILEESKSVQTALWPEPEAEADEAVLNKLDYMRGVLSAMRSAEASIAKKKGKGKATGTFDPAKPRSARIFVATSFPAWQHEVVESVREVYEASGDKSVDDKKVRESLNAKGLGKDKRVMPFMQQFKVSQTALRGRADTRMLTTDTISALSSPPAHPHSSGPSLSMSSTPSPCSYPISRRPCDSPISLWCRPRRPWPPSPRTARKKDGRRLRRKARSREAPRRCSGMYETVEEARMGRRGRGRWA